MFEKTDDLTVLKTLTSTLNDSVKGYRDAAEEVGNADLKQLFIRFADDRTQASQSLKDEVRRLGGTPDEDGSTMGSLHQAWLDLKSAVTGHSDEAVINEVERGEDYLKEKFETALNDDSLTGESRSVVEQAYTSVRAGHDQMSALKHSFSN